MARRTKEAAAETREHILEVALDVFSKKGYSRTTFVDIAKEIGLSKGAVYWHFKTKPDLLAALISHRENRQCSHILNAQPESIQELREMIVAMAQEVATNEDVRKFEFFHGFQIEWSEGLIAEVHEKLTNLRGDPLADFGETLIHLQETGELDPDVDVHELAWMLGSFWVGSLHLTLHEKMGLDLFPKLMGRNFDLVVGQYATGRNQAGE